MVKRSPLKFLHTSKAQLQAIIGDETLPWEDRIPAAEEYGRRMTVWFQRYRANTYRYKKKYEEYCASWLDTTGPCFKKFCRDHSQVLVSQDLTAAESSKRLGGLISPAAITKLGQRRKTKRRGPGRPKKTPGK